MVDQFDGYQHETAVTVSCVKQPYISYARSLIWIGIALGICLSVSLIVNLVIVDFIRGNPNRTQGNALLMMTVYPFIITVIAIVGAFLVFAVSQTFQAIVVDLLSSKSSIYTGTAVLLATPLTAVITWYCYEYCTPTAFRVADSIDWEPYQYGLTISRYLKSFAIQLPSTLFSYLYWKTKRSTRSRVAVVASGIAFAAIAGLIWGYWLTVLRDLPQIPLGA
jgi:hypothetical protein